MLISRVLIHHNLITVDATVSIMSIWLFFPPGGLFCAWGSVGAERDYAEQWRPVCQLLLQAHGDTHCLQQPAW
jgi:hypothetical protein